MEYLSYLKIKIAVMEEKCQQVSLYLRGIDTLRREVTLVKIVLSPSEKGSTLKGKNLGSNFFPFRTGSFQ